jgi:aspartyl aminopeptidase
MNPYKLFFNQMNMVKTSVPKGTFENSIILDERRAFPSMECLTQKQLEAVKKRIVKLTDFHSKAKLSFQAVDYFGNLASESGFEERNCDDDSPFRRNKLFYKDPWQQSSMILVNKGIRPITEGFRVVVAHVDAPCLRVKPRPLRIEEKDTEKYYSYLGIRLSTIPHGGVLNSNWMGKSVKVMGYTINKDRTRRNISFPGFIGINSVHVESDDTQSMREYYAEKTLEVITGYAGVKDLLKKLHFQSMDDFVNSRLWAVPTNEMQTFNEEFPNLLVGYGHDNRTTTFSAVDAIIRTKLQQYTSFVWLNDNEEIFDPAPAGTRGNFLEVILEKLIEEQEGREHRKLLDSEKSALFRKSRLIIGDTTFAPYGPDAGEKTDYKSASKIGMGAVIEGGDIQGYNPVFLRDLRNLTDGIPQKKARICHQITGDFYNQDEVPAWYTRENPAFPFADKGLSGCWVAIPCGCLHSSTEVICPGDEYAASELYKRFFESKIKAI